MVNPSLPANNQVLDRRLAVLLIALTFAFAVGGTVRADDEHLGIIEYEIACMPCHGVEGRGDGPRAKTLRAPPADLTQITKSNHGKFPLNKVAEMIDGRAMVAAHGSREMPVWGDRYRNAAEAGESPTKVEQRARAQINALVRYLEIIQER